MDSPSLKLHAQILAGGTGTRLWPMSRRSRPKQLLDLVGEETMLQETVHRLEPLIPPERVTVLTNREYVDEARRQLPQVPSAQVIGEPEALGTAPAAGLGAALVAAKDPDATVVLLPADHVIKPAEALHQALRRAAIVAAEGWLVTFGLKPRYAATGYGYIEVGEDLPGESGARYVERFVEKPKPRFARKYAADGRHFWNSGMFAWRADAFLRECRQHLPDLAQTLDDLTALVASSLTDPSAFEERLADIWRRITDKTTVDYGIMEPSNRVACLPTTLDWSDVGSWAALQALLPLDEHGNAVIGDHIGANTKECLIYSAGGRLVTTLGLDGVVVVDTPDALLVCSRDSAEGVRKIVDELRDAGHEELT